MIVTPPAAWDAVHDVVVVGTGAAALVAATMAADGGARVLVVEKDDVVGGTTGVSGGVLWLPNNHHMAEAGVTDSRDDALTYIRRVACGREPDPSLVEVFVDTAPEMLAYLEANTPLRMQPVRGLPDYYFHPRPLPGAKPFARSLEPKPFSVRAELPEWADRLAARSTLLSLGASTTLSEDLAGVDDPAAHLQELARREREGMRMKGAALVGALLKGLVDRGVEVRTSTPATELVSVGGEVVGLRCTHGGGDQFFGARRGVVLACGGFEWNAEMVRGFIGFEPQPLSPGGNTGDGHVMAMEAGAKLANMNSFWGQGAMFDPSITRDGEPVAQMNANGAPGSLIVNRQGVRFMNESATYNDFAKPFGAFDQRFPGFPNAAPGWYVFDDERKRSAPILSVAADAPAPEWIAQAPTIAELAARIGVDAGRLEQTVARFNEHAARGEDPEFGRVSVRPLGPGPFYAAQVFPATLGTNGGCRIDADGRVLGYRQPVIPGLYAAGNTSAGVFGWAYVGGGTPLGLGATFGYRAGRHAATRKPHPLFA